MERSMITTNLPLEDLDYDDFVEQIEGTLGNTDNFAPFLAPEVLPKTLDYLEQLRDSLESQLETWTPETPNFDADWAKRTQGFRSLVLTRTKLVKRRLGLEVAHPGVSRNVELSAWKRFAHRLCEVLDDYEEASLELDVLEAPFGGLTARQWLARRIEKDPERTGANA